ncbi:MAG: TRAP transporter small permease [Synergistales bacterium]|nr:TRAP transporter small permease [Synergistales bacterium]
MGHLLVKINQFFAELSSWFLSIIMILLTVNYITRFFGVPIQGLLELSTFVFLAIIYLGLGHCEENDEHIKVNAIIKRVPPKVARALNTFNYLLAVFIGGVITYAALNTAISAYQSGESVPGTAPLLTYPVKFAIFIGSLFFVLQAAAHLVSILKTGRYGEML